MGLNAKHFGVSKRLKYVQRQLGNLVRFQRTQNDVPILVFVANDMQHSLCWMGTKQILRMFSPYPSHGKEVTRRDFTPNEFVEWFREANGLDRCNQTQADRDFWKAEQAKQAWQRMSVVGKFAQQSQADMAAAVKRKADDGVPFLSIIDSCVHDARFNVHVPILEWRDPTLADEPLVYVEAFGRAFDLERLLECDDWADAAEL